MSVAYIGPKSRTERPRKTEIGTEVAHVTRDSDTTFKVKRSTWGEAYCGGLPHSLLCLRPHKALMAVVCLSVPCLIMEERSTSKLKIGTKGAHYTGDLRPHLEVERSSQGQGL